MALIALAIGAILVGTFLSYLGTNLISSRIFGRLVEGQYAADAGVEDAIWNLTYGDLTTTVLTSPGDSVGYLLTESVNGLSPDVTITRNGIVQASVADDDCTIAVKIAPTIQHFNTPK